MTDSDENPQTGQPGEDPPEVSRESVKQARDARRKRRRLAVVGGVAALIVAGVVLALVFSGGDDEPTASSTTTSSSTTSTTTTIPEVLANTVMPLTGVPVNGDDPETASLLNRPALIAKVDNDPAAMPHFGLERADVVMELRVEGISRYMAVFHSQPVDRIGPIRSARTSDPDLLAMFGHPLFVWSGGNANVVKKIRAVPFIQNESHDKAQSAYSRVKARRAPHNLVVDASKIFDRADQPPAVPAPIFSYRSDKDPAVGLPVAGVSLTVGSSPSSFVWDDQSQTWLRWANNRRHVTPDGDQLQARNVVVLSTSYGRSAADSRSPEAESIGSGNAWVFSGGTVQPGTWSRSAADQPWALTSVDGQPLTLIPGNTWVELIDRSSEPRMLDSVAAEALRSK